MSSSKPKKEDELLRSLIPNMNRMKINYKGKVYVVDLDTREVLGTKNSPLSGLDFGENHTEFYQFVRTYAC